MVTVRSSEPFFPWHKILRNAAADWQLILEQSVACAGRGPRRAGGLGWGKAGRVGDLVHVEVITGAAEAALQWR